MKKIISIIGIILALIVIAQYQENKALVQTVVPDLSREGCFEKADCFVPIRENYCNVKFDCIQGKCYKQNILCPEVCNSGEDEDLDKIIDCKDPDCWDSPLCSCTIASFNACKEGACWCPEGKSSQWFVSDTNYCDCV